MKPYDPKTIEPKWQKTWADTKLYAARDADPRPKYYMLTEFPYPSGEGLHAGHAREYTLGDVMARHKRMLGYNVLFPMGFDAFGLPAENFAIKHKIHPSLATTRNIANFQRQMSALGLGFDWDRTINTTDPAYYKWTQWLFLQFFKAGLAYQAEIAINWCPFEKTGLANEEVVNGVHERCGTPVEKKVIKQWLLAITKYADRLIDGLKDVDYPPRIADQQINWIGHSEGAEIDFAVGGDLPVKRVVLLHGRGGGPDKTWLPWLKSELEKRGVEVEAPALPNPSEPNADEQADYIERHCRLDAQTTIVGQSSGGHVALRLLERGHQVQQVILTSTPYSGEFMDGKLRPSVTEQCRKGFQFESIKENSEKFLVIRDTTDQIVPPEDAERLAEHLGAALIEAAGTQPHFYGDQEPAILATVVPTVTAYTTRPDTLGGATFLVLAPEHAAVPAITTPEQKAAVDSYIKQTQSETELGRQEQDRPKTGVFTGAYAQNPITRDKMPVWIADYVLAGYGTGAIMAVPAHDERDFAFAKAFNLPIKTVINPEITRDDAKNITNFETRRSIVATVENDRGEILTINWGPKLGGRLTIGGKIEGGDSAETTARREVTEETGYHDLEVVGVGQEALRYKYFAFSKGKAHDTMVTFVHIRLKSDARQPQQLDAEEKNNFEVEWVSREQAEREITEPLHRYGLDKWIFGRPFTGEGPLTGSGRFDGLAGAEAKHAIVEWLFEQGLARHSTKYRLRDWIFSRQHYWGEPIPIVHCEKDGAVAVPDDELPVKLPEVEKYEPTDTGASPLAAIPEFVNTTCPKCGGAARRETDTMPNWAGSSWYYLRYMDPHNNTAFADPAKLKYWSPVDLYLGGMEHTTLHLLYSRFWHQFLYDQKLVPTPEPYAARRGQGIVLAPDGRKMSKSLGNVIDPSDVIARYGADAFRLYIMFMAPYDETTPWSDERLGGVSRFLYRVWTLAQDLMPNVTAAIAEQTAGPTITEIDRATHKTIKKVHDDLEGMRFNTIVSTLMEHVNFLNGPRIREILTDPANAALAQRTLRALLLLLAPSAPFMTEELWAQLSQKQRTVGESIHAQGWPKYDPELIKDELVTIVVQINGKVRGTLAAPADISEAELINLASIEPKIAELLEAKTIANTVVVPLRLVNFVVK